jgi:hypothetical protein
MRYKPSYLPQISMPYEMVLQKLDEEGVDYELIELNPKEDDNINVSQGVTFSDEIEKVNLADNNPIWIAGENMNICDGHHRYLKALIDKVPLKAVKIGLNEKDAYRLLNKIQDIYEYQQKQQMEEVITQDVINQDNQASSGVSDSEFLNSLEEDNIALKPSGDTDTNSKVIIGYRKDPIKENSVVGNFFLLKPVEGFDKYEIEFDNLLDLHSLGVTYKDGQEPVDIMAKIWFPHINFEKISEQYGMPSINLKNKAIAEKAMKLGYDGIKYGDTLIQGLK